MSKQPNRRLIGLFMLVGIFGFVGILGFLLQNKVFGNKGNEVVMYFEESINGLNIGSPVVFKGVKIGEVSKISIVTDPHTLNFSIPVYARMHTKALESVEERIRGRELLDDLVSKGLRARLATQSFVTGQLMIELEMFPGTPVKYHNDGSDVEIPTTLSPLGELSRSLQKLPIEQGAENFVTFFKGLNDLMPEVRKIVKEVDGIVSRNRRTSTEVLENFNQATVNVSRAAKSMQNLTDYLERHPEALLRGKK